MIGSWPDVLRGRGGGRCAELCVEGLSEVMKHLSEVMSILGLWVI